MKSARHSAMWGMFIGDAITMPVHWYYNPSDIKTDYGGWLTGYEAPKEKHPTSIMNLSNTGGSGRIGGKVAQQIIGNVILHDKLKYWSGKKGVHYHTTLKAGENTLNAALGFETFKFLQQLDPDYQMEPLKVRQKFLENYVKFMTTPGSHNDSYAESSHRLFFQNWCELDSPPSDGQGLEQFCQNRYKKVNSSNEDHQLCCIGSVVFAVPWVLHYSGLSEQDCAANTVEALKLTHPAPSLMEAISLYARLLHSVVNGADLKTEVLKIAANPAMGSPNKSKAIQKYSAEASKYPAGSEARLRVYQGAVSELGLACYVPGSMVSMLLMAYEFPEDLKSGVLTNANCGGENTHRGGALGALIAANMVNKGLELPNELVSGLYHTDKYQNGLQ